MHLVKPMAKYFFFCVLSLLIYSNSFSQENSPFSRYGIGDVYPQQNIAARAMGGLGATVTNSQFINTINPASYGSLGLVTYDFALTVDSRSLISKTPANKYKSVNFIPSYITLGMPLTKPGNINGAALVFGLRPATRINYSIQEGSRISYDSLGITDSVQTLHEGNGGLNQVFLGIGKTWKSKKNPNNSFSLGFNAGYEWGTKFISNKVTFPSDSSYQTWYNSNSTDSTHLWGLFLNPGFMVSFTVDEKTDPISKLKNSYVLTVGASGTLEQKLDASRDFTRETFYYKDDGDIVPVDSVNRVGTLHGNITLPMSFNGGLMLNNMISNGPFTVKKWGIGVEYNFAQWSKYRDYGQADKLNNSSFIRGGIEFSPNPLTGKGIFSNGIYRFGYYNGKDYIDADGNGYKTQAFTLGYSFNLRKYHSYDRQFTMINTALEFGKRGSTVNNVTENFFKISVGLSLSDIWFIKRKYD